MIPPITRPLRIPPPPGLLQARRLPGLSGPLSPGFSRPRCLPGPAASQASPDPAASTGPHGHPWWIAKPRRPASGPVSRYARVRSQPAGTNAYAAQWTRVGVVFTGGRTDPGRSPHPSRDAPHPLVRHAGEPCQDVLTAADRATTETTPSPRPPCLATMKARPPPDGLPRSRTGDPHRVTSPLHHRDDARVPRRASASLKPSDPLFPRRFWPSPTCALR